MHRSWFVERRGADGWLVMFTTDGLWEKTTVPIDDPARLRAVLDQIANALQPAVVITGELHRRSATTVQDLAALDAALARVVGILRSVQAERAE